MSLNRDDILTADDIEIVKVDVPEWGGSVYVKGMSGTERDAFESSIIEQRGQNYKANLTNIRAKLCAQVICDKVGGRLFTDKDIKKLGEKSASALQRLFDIAQKLSGLGADDVDELAEELEKNPSGGSVSA